MRVRLLRTDDHGSQSKCRHQIGIASGPSSETVCIAERTEGGETCDTRHLGEEVALEADALYIRVGKNQILGRPFLPCTILSGDYVAELLAEAKELVDWQTLFADIIFGPPRILAMPAPSTPSFCSDGKTTFSCRFVHLEESERD
jgi:hypothetical protein